MIIFMVFLMSSVHSFDYFRDIEKCPVTQNGQEYIGTVSVTKSGKECKMWKERLKNRKDIEETSFADKDITLAKNYCRNPTSEKSGLWCFYGDGNDDFEVCNVPLCVDVEDCKDTISGEEYDGSINITKSNKECQAWKKQTPHNHRFTESYFPEKDYNIIGNKCRNPDNDKYPWCYTTDSAVRFEYCNIPMCREKISDAEFFRGPDHLKLLSRFVIETTMENLISNITVIISISTKFWSEDVQKKISVWGTEYSSKCQRDLSYYEYCQTTKIVNNEDEIKIIFICKKILSSVLIIIPLREEEYSYDLEEGPPVIIKSVLSPSIENYMKEVSRKSQSENPKISIKNNGGPFYLLSDNVIPYAVTKDDEVVMTISNVGKGRIGFMGGEYFIEPEFADALQDFFKRVYGKYIMKPDQITKSYMLTLSGIWKSKKEFQNPVIWNAHNTIGKENVDLLLMMVQSGLNLIIGIKPWAYFYYTNTFQESEIKELLLFAGIWPSRTMVYGNLRILKEAEFKVFPLIHLFDYAKINLTCAVSVSKLIIETLKKKPYYEFSKDIPSVTLMSKIRTKMFELYHTYIDVIKSFVPCLKNPLIQSERRMLIDMYNSMLLNPLGNQFSAPGINFYPGTVEPRDKSLETVRIKLNLNFNDENVFLGVLSIASQKFEITLQTVKSKMCFLSVNFHLFDITNWDRWDKWPRTFRRYYIKANTTSSFSNSFGGLLSIACDTNEDNVEVTVSKIARVPLYDRRNEVLGKDWNELRKRNIPWAILAADSIIFIVPSIAIRHMVDPRPIMELWDKIVKEEFHLRGRSVSETYRELVSTDFQIKAGYMHAGYPIGTFIQHVANPVIREKYLFAGERFVKEGYWGITHEVGHNLQDNIFTFSGTVDVTNNVFTLVATENIARLSSWDKSQGWVKSDLADIINHIKNRNFSTWQSKPFVALGTYAQLRAHFGWEFYRQIFRRYDKLILDHKNREKPMTNEEKVQLWIIESSELVKMNLLPLYDYWAWPINEETKKSLGKYPLFLPDDFLTQMTEDKVEEIMIKYGGENTVVRKPLPIPELVGPLKKSTSIEGSPVVQEITIL